MAGTKRADLQRHDLGIPGREVVQVRIDFDPGAAFGKHTHPGEEISYVLDGPLEYQTEDNLAVFAYNVLRGIYVADVNGSRQFFYGLEGTTADQLPADVWFAAMNECDVAMDLGNGLSEKQFTGGGEITVDTEPLDVIKSVLQSCGGRFVENGGIYKIYIGAPGLPVLSFTDDAIVANQEDHFKPVLGLNDRVNYITGTDTSPADGWVSKVAPPREMIAWRTEDGRRSILKETLENAWTSLRPDQRATMTRSLLAERILRAAADGERDRERLFDAALDLAA